MEMINLPLSKEFKHQLYLEDIAHALLNLQNRVEELEKQAHDHEPQGDGFGH